MPSHYNHSNAESTHQSRLETEIRTSELTYIGKSSLLKVDISKTKSQAKNDHAWLEKFYFYEKRFIFPGIKICVL